jgi:ABC-type multidrug transport system ATPase subunit
VATDIASSAAAPAVEARKRILHAVSGQAAPGECIAIMGPRCNNRHACAPHSTHAAELMALSMDSGCGKTTLLNILAGQKSLTDGVLTVNGAPLPKHFRRLVGCALASPPRKCRC